MRNRKHFFKTLFSSLNLKGSSFKLAIIFQIPSLSFAASAFRISSDISNKSLSGYNGTFPYVFNITKGVDPIKIILKIIQK